MDLSFQSDFVHQLPGDPNLTNQSRTVSGACYSRVQPTPASNPQLLAVSTPLAHEMGISKEWFSSDIGVGVLSGNRLLPGMVPYAMCYGGHQFGNWAGQLGDGRAINLGEFATATGTSWTWQLKGAGKTPYSRFGDGLAVLRSSIREFLCSEAMHFLGIPTTRALSLVATGDHVTRDMFYDGRPRKELGAVVCRVAPSFIRFGNFEILAARQDHVLMKALADFTIRKHFDSSRQFDLDLYEDWFTSICLSSAKLVIDWMRVGFVHGVLNTDNMSILGLTIDYGPYGWIDHLDFNWTPNTTDAEGRRYCFGNQPQIVHWNIVQLANALYPLFNQKAPLQRALDRFAESLQKNYLTMQLAKVGLTETSNENDRKLIESLEHWMTHFEVDMTIFYRMMADLILSELNHDPLWISDPWSFILHYLGDSFYHPNEISESQKVMVVDWFKLYFQRITQSVGDRTQAASQMNRINPKYVLRNYMTQSAIEEAERGNLSELDALLKLIERPYDEQPDQSRYFAKRPEWARHKAGCSMLSCSS